MFNKIISCLIAAVCIAGTAYIPVYRDIPVAVADDRNVGGIIFSVHDGIAEITGFESGFKGDLTLPQTVFGCPVTAIQDKAFDMCTGLTAITLPSTLEYIGTYAFYGCTSLKTVTIPKMKSDNVELGDYAFFGCTALEGIEFPTQGFRYISTACFYGCTAMRSALLPDCVNEIRDYAFFNCSSLETLTIYDPFCKIPLDPALVCTSYTPDSYHFAGTICGLPNSTAEYYAQWCGEACLDPRNFEMLTYPDFGLGDANMNWKIDAADASEVLAEYARISTGVAGKFTDKQFALADVDRNGAINSADASKILEFYAYLSTGGRVKDLSIWDALPEAFR